MAIGVTVQVVVNYRRARRARKNAGEVEAMIKGIPRRSQLESNTPAELAIRGAIQAVEEVGADPLLTDAVILLGQAREKVADYVDGQG